MNIFHHDPTKGAEGGGEEEEQEHGGHGQLTTMSSTALCSQNVAFHETRQCSKLCSRCL